jgi:formylglycine-generating enzyme required for sulfatase activity
MRTLIIILISISTCLAQKPDFKVLAFYSKDVESDHVDFAKKLRSFMNDVSDERNFTFDVTSDWTNLNDTLLRNYQVVMWINEFPHTDAQRKSFQKFIENGGGWIGFHVAGYNDETTNWPWFVDFMGGAVFYTNNWPPLPARLIIDDTKHPVTQNVPSTIMAPTNEWYQWKPSPRENKNVKVLVTLDPLNYPIGIKDIIPGGDTPVVWTNTKFNMVYINMGHGDFVMSDKFQNQLVIDAVMWVGKGRSTAESPAGDSARKKKVASGSAARDSAGKTFFAAESPEGDSAFKHFPEMISVKGGTFMMGDDNGEKDEKPSRKVTVHDFSIAKTETTIGQWRTYCMATGRRMPEAPWFQQNEQHPVVNVSWDNAIAYCKWLSEQTGKNYRLPTEAEWEFAARGGSRTKGYPYSGGKNADSVAWLAHKSDGTMPVAQKAANELGLFDMTGNVWEWTNDLYDKSGRFYTLRGGAWDIGVKNNRIAYRNPLAPTSRNHNKGFRVVCD